MTTKPAPVSGETAIYYDDEQGIHLCEGSQVHPDVFLVWTLCEKDVPASQGYRTSQPPFITCEDCLRVMQDNSQFGVGA